jgi:hypothetical protein
MKYSFGDIRIFETFIPVMRSSTSYNTTTLLYVRDKPPVPLKTFASLRSYYQNSFVLCSVFVAVHFNNYGTAELTYLLTCLLAARSRVLPEKLTGFAASEEIPRIYGTRKFITVLTSARQLSLS